MSYETNPILARITNNKGWKNPVFPNKRLNYSYEIVVWFKIYLLLKAYLSLYQLKLLTCEIRVSENHMKILYLSVTKQFEEKKLSKSKWKAKSPLLNLQSPLAKLQNHKARFLLYQDFKTLRKQSVFTFNQWQKKILSKAWFSKPRLSSWINFSTYIGQFRRHSKIIQQLSRKSKKTFCGKKKIIVCRTKTRNLNFQQNARYNYQKKIKTLFTKTKREIWFLKKSLYTLAQYKITTSSFKYLFHKLIKQHQKKIDFLEKLTFLYQTWISVISIQQRQHPFKNFRYKIQHKKKRVLFKLFLFHFKKQINLFQKQHLFFQHKAQYLTLCHDIFFGKRKRRLFFINQTNSISKFFLKFQTLSISNMQKTVIKKNNNNKTGINLGLKNHSYFKIGFNTKSATSKIWHQSTKSLIKTRLFQRKSTTFEFHLAKLIRFRQKTKITKTILKKITTKNAKKKKNTTNKYRIPYKYNYKTHLSLLTNFKLKYLIQDFIQQYFTIHTYVKILWPLVQIKNLKFYRLAFSKNKYHYAQQKTFNTLRSPKKISLQKRYVFIGYATKHLKMRTLAFKFRNKQTIKTMFATKLKLKTNKKLKLQTNNTKLKKNQKKKLKNKKKVKLKKSLNINLTNRKQKNKISYGHYTENKGKHLRKKSILNIISSLWRKKRLKKNRYLLLKNKIIEQQTQKRLHWIGKIPYITNLLPTLTLFAKYLDPQPLAEDLAKILGQTKKHSLTLRFIEKVLSTLKLKRGVGYRIALIGRADGANKTRTIYLKKLNRNWARQTFSKNVNFGSAQARATIGAFGVKVWVYF